MSVFSRIKRPRVKRSKFDLSRELKASYSFDYLYPVFLEEVIPGDSFRIKVECLLRAFPMLAPLMHRVNVKMNFFFVPTRILWDEWEDFITGGRLGDQSPVVPYTTFSNAASISAQLYTKPGSLWDHLGLPVAEENVTQPININMLPFRAYQRIYHEYFRDQNLSAGAEQYVNSGYQSTSFAAQATIRKAAWEKDYFTSALPWPQRGPEVLMPMEADVNYRENTIVRSTSTGNPIGNAPGFGTNISGELLSGDPPSTESFVDNIEDIANATTTINDFRKAVAIQRWLETAARAGSRYVEQVLAHFGVHTGDARLDRPEYIGGYSQPLSISEVLSTVDDTANDLPQGNMSGHGISVGSNIFKYSPREHGYIMGVMSIIPRTGYQQGIHRMWSRADKFDYAFPEFANLGEQEVLNKELYATLTGSASDINDETFGYQARYAEYKYGISRSAGQFRTSLAYWHMNRIFSGLPALNADFVESSASDRIFPVQDGSDKFYAQMYMKVDAKRPLPYFGTPGLSKI